MRASRVELRPEFYRSEFRQSEFRQGEFCRCQLPGVAGLRRKLPRHELSQRAWLRSAGAGHGLRPWRSGRSRLRFLPQRAGAGLRPGAAKRPAAAIASLRRHLRSTAADFVGLDRAEPPARAGFLRGRAARCRFPRRRSGDSRAGRPRQVRHDVQRPQRLHGGQRAARRHRSRRRLGLRLQTERRRAWQRSAALGHGRQPAGERASR